MAFSQFISDRVKVNLGGTWAPQLRLPGTLETVFYSATNLNSPSSYDTLYNVSTKGTILQGNRLVVSSLIELKLKDRSRKNKTKHPLLTVGLEYVKNSPHRIDFPGSTYDSINRKTIASELYGFGIEFKPERYLNENLATLGFFDKFSYRLGAYYGSLPYSDVQNNLFKVQALTFGLGVPILSQQSLSSLNFSCVLGQRGTFLNGSINENFMYFQFTAVVAAAGFGLMSRWVIFLFLLPFLGSCINNMEDVQRISFNKKSPDEAVIDFRLIYNELGSAKVEVRSAYSESFRQPEYITYLKDSLRVNFFAEDGTIKSSMTAKFGKINHTKDIIEIRDSIRFYNYGKKQLLKTELLFWNRKDSTITTDKPVMVTAPNGYFYGKGVRAKQDFSTYEILRPEGHILIEKENEFN
jgi:LPS export ABC transporter protein LptC